MGFINASSDIAKAFFNGMSGFFGSIAQGLMTTLSEFITAMYPLYLSYPRPNSGASGSILSKMSTSFTDGLWGILYQELYLPVIMPLFVAIVVLSLILRPLKDAIPPGLIPSIGVNSSRKPLLDKIFIVFLGALWVKIVIGIHHTMYSFTYMMAGGSSISAPGDITAASNIDPSSLGLGGLVILLLFLGAGSISIMGTMLIWILQKIVLISVAISGPLFLAFYVSEIEILEEYAKKAFNYYKMALMMPIPAAVTIRIVSTMQSAFAGNADRISKAFLGSGMAQDVGAGFFTGLLATTLFIVFPIIPGVLPVYIYKDKFADSIVSGIKDKTPDKVQSTAEKAKETGSEVVGSAKSEVRDKAYEETLGRSERIDNIREADNEELGRKAASKGMSRARGGVEAARKAGSEFKQGVERGYKGQRLRNTQDSGRAEKVGAFIGDKAHDESKSWKYQDAYQGGGDESSVNTPSTQESIKEDVLIDNGIPQPGKVSEYVDKADEREIANDFPSITRKIDSDIDELDDAELQKAVQEEVREQNRTASGVDMDVDLDDDSSGTSASDTVGSPSRNSGLKDKLTSHVPNIIQNNKNQFNSGSGTGTGTGSEGGEYYNF